MAKCITTTKPSSTTNETRDRRFRQRLMLPKPLKTNSYAYTQQKRREQEKERDNERCSDGLPLIYQLVSCSYCKIYLQKRENQRQKQASFSNRQLGRSANFSCSAQDTSLCQILHFAQEQSNQQLSNIISYISLRLSPASLFKNITDVPSGTFRVCHTAPLDSSQTSRIQHTQHIQMYYQHFNFVIITFLSVFPSILLTDTENLAFLYLQTILLISSSLHFYISLLQYLQQVGYQTTCSFQQLSSHAKTQFVSYHHLRCTNIIYCSLFKMGESHVIFFFYEDYNAALFTMYSQRHCIDWKITG